MKRKVLSVVVAIVMLSALAIPALATSNNQVVVDPDTRIWQDGFGFHCNHAKGNGATAVEYIGGVKAIEDSIAKIKKQPAGSLVVEKGDQKDIFGTRTFPITLERVGATTTWDLITDDIECRTCGRTDWITYSNNSGVINGKNIQANHPPLPVETEDPPPTFHGMLVLEKTVNGENIGRWLERNDFDISLLSFEAEHIATGAKFPGDLNALAGIISFAENMPTGLYTITETMTGAARDIFVNIGGVTRGEFFVGEDGIEADDIEYISGINFGTPVVAGRICPDGGALRNWDLPAVWNGFFAGSKQAAKYAELRAMGAEWVWNTDDTYKFGIDGSIYEDTFSFYANVSGTAKAYFAADNVAVIYLNEKLVGYTTVALRDSLEIGEDYDENVLGNLDFSDFDGRWSEGWNHLYEIEIPYVAGENTVNVIAANSVSTGRYNDESVFIRGNAGTDNDTYNFTNNPCGLIFGFVLPGATFDNKLVPSEFSVSFNKAKYGGLLPVADGEFEFELFRIVNGNEERVDRYKTTDNGSVAARNLSAGNYVFREVLAVDHDSIPNGSHGYRYVWNAQYPGDADGLYFTIDSSGRVIWEDGFNGTLNNVHYCKHAFQWTFSTDEANFLWALDNGWKAYPGPANHPYAQWGIITANQGCPDSLTKITIEPATCISDTMVNIWCDCPVSATGWRFGIPETALGCNFEPWVGGFNPVIYGWFNQQICKTDGNHRGDGIFVEDLWLDTFEANYNFRFETLDLDENGISSSWVFGYNEDGPVYYQVSNYPVAE